MRRLVVALVALALLATACGASDDDEAVSDTDVGAAGTCLAGDPDCQDLGDGGAADPLPSVIALGDPDDPNAPIAISFGGFFYSDGETAQLCSALAESFPPQCATTVIEIEAPFEVVLEHVAETFGNPDDARINEEQGIYWTDEWVNLTGTLQANRLVLE